ncbi:MAG: bifunctional precorrin-2 dehydrogenase/sirohydrochlorin ferrochelatase [Actinomycetota bacterium]
MSSATADTPLGGTGSEPGRAGLGGYPVNLLVQGRRCVVVGAGRIAARKIDALVEAGADVHVIAPDAVEEIRTAHEDGRLTWHARGFAASDLDDAWLATTATSDPDVNRAVFVAGEARRVFVNSADDPQNCSFTLMSLVRQGDLVVTVGTGGRSPALATFLRNHVRDEMGPEYSVLLDVLSEARETMRAGGRSSEDADWQAAIDSGMLDLIRRGRVAEAKELLQTCLSSSSD